MNEIQGWINLYKPKNISSFQAINKLKKKFFFKKIGHAGTLDPLAEGILPIALGKATKLISMVNKDSKKYIFTITWGVQTSSDDSDGQIINKSNLIPNFENINNKIHNYSGYIFQIPPKVSAVKVKGRRAYELARKKVDFQLTPKKVHIKNIKILEHDNYETKFEIECGKGFYIRSLARDLSSDLGTFGHISNLIRTKVGKFNEDSSILLDDLLKIGERHSDINCIHSSISMLDDILAFEIEDLNHLRDLSFGKSINIDERKIKNLSSKNIDSNLVLLSNKGDIVSIGKLIGSLFKPSKILI